MSSSALDHAGVKYRRCETGAERERERDKRGKGEGQRERNVHKLHIITVSLQVLLCTINIVLCHLEISLLSQLGCDLS